MNKLALSAAISALEKQEQEERSALERDLNKVETSGTSGLAYLGIMKSHWHRWRERRSYHPGKELEAVEQYARALLADVERIRGLAVSVVELRKDLQNA